MFAVPPPKFGTEGWFPAGSGPPGSGDPGLVEISITMVWVMVWCANRAFPRTDAFITLVARRLPRFSFCRAPGAGRCYTYCGGQDDPTTVSQTTGPLRRADAMLGRSKAARRSGLGIRDQVRRLPSAWHQERRPRSAHVPQWE